MNSSIAIQPDCAHCNAATSEKGRCQNYRRNSVKFWLLDVGFGALLGLLIVGFHEYLVPNDWPLLWFFLASMSLMMILQSLLSFLIGSLIGSMEAMIPGGFIAMGAMTVAYLPLTSRPLMVALGAVTGLAISIVFVVKDAWLRGASMESLPVRRSSKTVGPPRFALRTPAWLYDLRESAGARRRAYAQRILFANMGEHVLFVAAGSGLNFANFPPHRRIVAIDVNVEMLRRAEARSKSYDGTMEIMEADVQKLPFQDESFDTVATASTFCSVPNPEQGLSELYRVLKPGGRLLMFEHVRSRNPLIALEQDMMNLAMRFLGSDINRDTVGALRCTDFVIDHIRSAYLDVFLMIDGHKRSEMQVESIGAEGCETPAV